VPGVEKDRKFFFVQAKSAAFHARSSHATGRALAFAGVSHDAAQAFPAAESRHNRSPPLKTAHVHVMLTGKF